MHYILLAKQRLLGIFTLGWFLLSQTLSAQISIYSVPKALYYGAHNDDFTVRVRSKGGQWQDLYEYKVKVDADNVQEASMVYFDFEKEVEIAVTKNNGNIQTLNIRPKPKGLNYKLVNNTIFFHLNSPANLSLEINGDKLHNLHIFAGNLLKDIPQSTDKNVLYFGPGLHNPTDSLRKGFVIPSNTKVYIDGGAVLKGKLICDKVENVKIFGRGIIDNPHRGLEITFSKNIEIEGIIFRNPDHYTILGGQSKGIRIKNIKSFSCRGWSDGIDLMSCSNVNIDGIFMRNSDDCIAIYGHRWDYFGSAKNYTITNATLCADVAHPINIGIHGDTSYAGDTIENIHFKNIHILEHDEDDPDYEGCMAITDGDFNLVRNISFENIYVDDYQEGQLLNLRVVYNAKYNTGVGRGIENISFKNVFYNGTNLKPSILEGYDKDHLVKNVIFQNIYINKVKLDQKRFKQEIIQGKYTQGVLLKE